MRRYALTLAGKMRLQEVARLKLQIPRSKELAVELQISRSYVRQELSRLMREMSPTVPRGTEQLCDEKHREN